MFKGHKEARIYNITLFVTHVLMFIMVQLLYIPFRMRCMYNKMLVEIQKKLSTNPKNIVDKSKKNCQQIQKISSTNPKKNVNKSKIFVNKSKKNRPQIQKKLSTNPKNNRRQIQKFPSTNSIFFDKSKKNCRQI